MQFYIIHPEPKDNAELLPDYCIKNVNVREGWQMLSDIGHAHDITWEGQNKEYNRWHPNTLRFWRHQSMFRMFIDHYEMCLLEYVQRFNKTTKFHDWYYGSLEIIKGIKIKFDLFGQDICRYLLDRKLKHLTDDEIIRLKNYIGEINA